MAFVLLSSTFGLFEGVLDAGAGLVLSIVIASYQPIKSELKRELVLNTDERPKPLKLRALRASLQELPLRS